MPPADTGEAQAPVAPPAGMPTESKVLGIQKRHNQPWRGNWVALELDMLLAVVGQSGQHVGAVVTFFEEETGRPLRSAMQPYVDGEGNACVYTKLQQIQSNSRLLRARLTIPYRALPWPSKGPSYGVEARVRLVRKDAAGNFSVLATGQTTFTVHYQRMPEIQKPLDPCEAAKPDAIRNIEYDWRMMWEEDPGPVVSELQMPPPRGPGSHRPWYAQRWRTAGSTVDQKEAEWTREVPPR
jgi:hypothetical protein